MKRTIENYAKLFKAIAEALRRGAKENPGNPTYKNNLKLAAEYDSIVRLLQDQDYFDSQCYIYDITEDQKR